LSSGTQQEMGAGRHLSQSLAGEVMQRTARLGMTPRQQALQALWSRYRCRQYDGRKIAWDGRENASGLEAEQIATQGFLPPGFVDAGAGFPIRFRKPSAVYNLFRVIVNRFTSLLFSETKHPQIRVASDPKCEAYLRAVADAAHLWAAAITARTYGGATGTAVASFSFIGGVPEVEVHDPRWVFPRFKDRFSQDVSAIEIRFMYPIEVQNERRGWDSVLYWYRRTIDQERDVTYVAERVTDDEPDWREDPSATIAHGLGFAPVVWVQNLPMADDVDGEPDCEGVLELLDCIDQLLSQTHYGTVKNEDPTLLIVTSQGIQLPASLSRGSDNAIHIPDAAGKGSYLEIAAAGLEFGLKLALQFKDMVLEVAQCVLDGGDVAGKTATEVERRYASMLAKAGVLRTQYGDKLVKKLMQMMARALAGLGEGRQVQQEDGSFRLARDGLRLPNYKGETRDGIALAPPGLAEVEVDLQWPAYFDPSPVDVESLTRAASVAKTSQLIDQEHAVKFVAPLFRVENALAMIQKIQQERPPDLATSGLDALNRQPFQRGGNPPKPPGIPQANGAGRPGNGAAGQQRPPVARG
jgi:hypothetical protein